MKRKLQRMAMMLSWMQIWMNSTIGTERQMFLNTRNTKNINIVSVR